MNTVLLAVISVLNGIIANLAYFTFSKTWLTGSFITGSLLVTLFCAISIVSSRALDKRSTTSSNNSSSNKKPKTANVQRTKQDPSHKPQNSSSNKKSTAKKGQETGTVKWFNGNKGFGFITRENGEEIFVHYRSIEGEGKSRRHLRDGQQVNFIVVDGDKGPQAEEVSAA